MLSFKSDGGIEVEDFIRGKECPFISEANQPSTHTLQSFNLCDEDIVLDFFAGAGTTAQAALELNRADSRRRRYILVQLPEPLDPENNDQKVAATFCDQLGKSRNIAELTKERLRRAAKKVREKNPMFAGDLGFRVFKLASTNIREWDPESRRFPKTL